MLDVTQSQVEVETEFQVSLDTCVVSLSVISLDSISLSILASIIWYLAFMRDRERWFSASVRHFTLCSIVRKVIFLKQIC